MAASVPIHCADTSDPHQATQYLDQNAWLCSYDLRVYTLHFHVSSVFITMKATKVLNPHLSMNIVVNIPSGLDLCLFPTPVSGKFRKIKKKWNVGYKKQEDKTGGWELLCACDPVIRQQTFRHNLLMCITTTHTTNPILSQWKIVVKYCSVQLHNT